jgi:hypothetical protein
MKRLDKILKTGQVKMLVRYLFRFGLNTMTPHPNACAFSMYGKTDPILRKIVYYLS